jgi:hypothetical protein
MDSFDKGDHDDYVKCIMNDYQCERCEEKAKVISNNEQRIEEYIAYIKKHSGSRLARDVQLCSSGVQTDAEPQQNTSLDRSGGPLRSSHKILLSNYIRQCRVYLDNLEEEQSEKTVQMQEKLSLVAERQKITLFHEEEDPDTSLVTKELI